MRRMDREASSAPLITTVIPTYRRPILLRRAILSVLRQTYPNIRVAVFDNASGDETREFVAEIQKTDPRVEYYCHSWNIGSYPNFNAGIEAVKTPFFSLLSDDDVLVPTFYEEAMRTFVQHPEAMFLSMTTMVVDTDIRVVSAPLSISETKFYKPGDAVKEMLGGAFPWTWTGIVFRREVRDGIGLIDTMAGPHADGGYVCHAAARFPNVVVPGVAAVLMAHEESTSGSSVPVSVEWVRWWEAMMRAICEDRQVSPETLKYVRELLQPDYLHIGIQQVGRAVARGDYQYAARVAEGVQECGYPVSGKCLGFIVKISATTPVNALVRMIRALRRRWHLRKSRELHRKYGHLVEFIQQ